MDWWLQLYWAKVKISYVAVVLMWLGRRSLVLVQILTQYLIGSSLGTKFCPSYEFWPAPFIAATGSLFSDLQSGIYPMNKLNCCQRPFLLIYRTYHSVLMLLRSEIHPWPNLLCPNLFSSVAIYIGSHQHFEDSWDSSFYVRYTFLGFYSCRSWSGAVDSIYSLMTVHRSSIQKHKYLVCSKAGTWVWKVRRNSNCHGHPVLPHNQAYW